MFRPSPEGTIFAAPAVAGPGFVHLAGTVFGSIVWGASHFRVPIAMLAPFEPQTGVVLQLQVTVKFSVV
jgi:hypothetical protein